MKRSTWMLLACVLMWLMAVPAAAAPETEYPTGISGEATWTLIDGTMHITGQGIFSGVPNADCHPWEFFEEQIRHVVIEEGITVVGDLAFAHTYHLETVTIADSVTEICEGAFRNCYALKTVKLPAHLQTLGNFVFAYCEKLETVELPDSLTQMGESVFTGCTALTSVKLPKDLYDIQQMNFDSCMSLMEVTIPAGVGFLRHASFPNCFQLKKVVFEGDQPHTNGDPFYMGPADLTVYCYSDAKGWEDPLFYTYPVVKLDRKTGLPVGETNAEQPDNTGSGGEDKPNKQEKPPVGGETVQPVPTPGTPAPEIPEDPPAGTGDAGAGTTGESVIGGEEKSNTQINDQQSGDKTADDLPSAPSGSTSTAPDAGTGTTSAVGGVLTTGTSNGPTKVDDTEKEESVLEGVLPVLLGGGAAACIAAGLGLSRRKRKQ